MSVYMLSDDNIAFPDPSLAEPNGLLAIGGDLRVERLLMAYRQSIFPWYKNDSPMIDWNGKDQDLLALIKYTAESARLEKILENPSVIKTPVVRNGKQSTLGYQPDVWKGWS